MYGARVVEPNARSSASQTPGNLSMTRVFVCMTIVVLMFIGSRASVSQDTGTSTLALLPQPNEGQCGYPNVHIESGALLSDIDFCQPLSKVVNFFSDLGLDLEPQFFLSVVRQTKDTNAASYGTFNAASGEITIYRRKGQKIWGLSWSEDTATSVVVHEMVHMAILRLVGNKYPQLPHEWHEFIAYAVQLELLDESVRVQILERYADVKAFHNLIEINPYIYGLSGPEVFAVRAYKTVQVRGGSRFLKAVVLFEFKPPFFRDVFPMEP